MTQKPKRKFFDSQYVKHERRRHYVWAALLFGSVFVFVCVSFFLFGIVVVRGQSMEPLFHNGQKLILQKWSYFFKNPAIGDIVVFEDPENEKLLDVKRVIAASGDHIQIYGGRVYVNEEALNEFYLEKRMLTLAHRLNEKKFEIGKNAYFLMGDNREKSMDSRDFGAISKEKIVGKVLV